MELTIAFIFRMDYDHFSISTDYEPIMDETDFADLHKATKDDAVCRDRQD